MKVINRLIVILLALGIVLFGFVQFYIIPNQEKKEEQYRLSQQDPTTHDLDSILEYKNLYMGDSSNMANLFSNLPLSNIPTKFQLYPDTLAVDVNYDGNIDTIGRDKVLSSLIYNSTAAFSLIDNLEKITFKFDTTNYSINRTTISSYYDDFSNLLTTSTWKESVQKPLSNKAEVESTFMSLFD